MARDTRYSIFYSHLIPSVLERTGQSRVESDPSPAILDFVRSRLTLRIGRGAPAV